MHFSVPTDTRPFSSAEILAVSAGWLELLTTVTAQPGVGSLVGRTPT